MDTRVVSILVLSLVLLVPATARSEASETGCEAPRQPGCETCCRPLDNGMCTQLSWTGGPESKTKPWYNAQRALGKACPDGCKPCASCLERDAETLERLKPPDGCDCAHAEVGIDPCHMPRSCACFCSRYLRLAKVCGAPGRSSDSEAAAPPEG